MFYTKTKLTNGRTVKTDITDENVFTRCHECGRELPVDIAEILSDGEGDLFSTNIICCACTNKRHVKRRFSDGIRITTDGVALLADVMSKAGYGEQIFNLFYRFEIDKIQDLEPERLRSFADALADLAVEGNML